MLALIPSEGTFGSRKWGGGRFNRAQALIQYLQKYQGKTIFKR